MIGKDRVNNDMAVEEEKEISGKGKKGIRHTELA